MPVDSESMICSESSFFESSSRLGNQMGIKTATRAILNILKVVHNVMALMTVEY